MVARPFGMHDDAPFMAVINALRAADLTYGHLEMNLADYRELEYAAKGDWLGSFFAADPQLARDLRWAGIDLLSMAHNHSMDYGVAGMAASIRHCQAAGLAVAGTGADLEAARQPAYLETRNGRVALVSTSTGNKSHEWAGLPKGGVGGRPGINPLRVRMRYVLDAASAEQMKAVGRQLGILREAGGAMSFGMQPGEFAFQMPGDQSTRAWTVFASGDAIGVESRCDAGDLRGNLRSIDEAQKMADFVIVAHHFNIADGKRGDAVPQFAREFAHAAIDAGADVYVGHGWHATLGIEIYKGKPIIYGIGNFFAQSEYIRQVPYDSYEGWGHDVDRLPTLNPADEPLHPGLDRVSATWWTSALMTLEMQGGAFRSLRLLPVEMGRQPQDGVLTRPTGQGDHPRTDGRPFVATGETAATILDRFVRLSAPFGTEIAVEDGVGVITF